MKISLKLRSEINLIDRKNITIFSYLSYFFLFFDEESQLITNLNYTNYKALNHTFFPFFKFYFLLERIWFNEQL